MNNENTADKLNSFKKEFSVGSNDCEIKVKDFPAGIYIVTLLTAEGILSRKLEVR